MYIPQIQVRRKYKPFGKECIMKRILLKLVSLVCVLSMLFVGLCSCAEKKDNIVAISAAMPDG